MKGLVKPMTGLTHARLLLHLLLSPRDDLGLHRW